MLKHSETKTILGKALEDLVRTGSLNYGQFIQQRRERQNSSVLPRGALSALGAHAFSVPTGLLSHRCGCRPVPGLPWRRGPELVGQDLSLTLRLFWGPCPCKANPAGAGRAGARPRGEGCCRRPLPLAPLRPQRPWWRLGTQSLPRAELNSQSAGSVCPNRWVLRSGLTASPAGTANGGVGPASCPATPLPARPRDLGGRPLKITFTIVRVGRCHRLTSLACELLSASSVQQQHYRKIKSQTNGTIVFWTSVFSRGTDYVNSAVSSGALCGPLACSHCMLQLRSLPDVGKVMQSQCTRGARHNREEGNLNYGNFRCSYCSRGLV